MARTSRSTLNSAATFSREQFYAQVGDVGTSALHF
jgi:hypothetical protein